MKTTYWKDTDTLYIALREDSEGRESEEISPGIVADFTGSGELTGPEFYASERLDLTMLAVDGMPVEVHAALQNTPERKARR